MATEPSSAIGRRRLRVELRRARDAAHLTQEQVAREMEWSLSKLIRIETGAVGVSTNDLRALLRLYQVDDPARVRELTELARASRRKPAWWAEYRDLLSDAYRKFIELEAAASVVRHFHPLAVPGLLQTPRYARAVVAVGDPRKLDEDTIQRFVDVRMIRQRERFSQESHQVTALLGEAAVRQVVGGRAVMREQLRFMLQETPPGVTVRVVPFSAGAHPGLSGGFALLEFADPLDDHVLYLENSPHDFIEREDADRISDYRRAFSQLSECALNTEDTASLLANLIDELG